MSELRMKGSTPTDLAVVLHDLAWLLPRTIGNDPDPVHVLPPSEFEIMRLLIRRPGLSVNQTAGALRLQPANVSTALRALEARGLLERRRDPKDQRVVRLHPTDAALAHRHDQEIAWGNALAQTLAALPTVDAARLVATTPALRTLALALRREVPTP
jgi:DNA-binding MarR family transcriptional regulator